MDAANKSSHKKPGALAAPVAELAGPAPAAALPAARWPTGAPICEQLGTAPALSADAQPAKDDTGMPAASRSASSEDDERQLIAPGLETSSPALHSCRATEPRQPLAEQNVAAGAPAVQLAEAGAKSAEAGQTTGPAGGLAAAGA